MTVDVDVEIGNRIDLSLKQLDILFSLTVAQQNRCFKKHVVMLLCNVVWCLQYPVLPEGELTEIMLFFWVLAGINHFYCHIG